MHTELCNLNNSFLFLGVWWGGGGWWGVQSSAKFCDKKDVFDEMIMIAYSLVAEIVPLVEICKKGSKIYLLFCSSTQVGGITITDFHYQVDEPKSILLLSCHCFATN